MCVHTCVTMKVEGMKCAFACLQVIPVLLHNVPLKEDMEENGTVYGCIISLLKAGNQIVRTQRLYPPALSLSFAPSLVLFLPPSLFTSSLSLPPSSLPPSLLLSCQ